MKLIINKLWLLVLLSGICTTGCDDEFLELFPPDEISEGTFWKDEKDAIKALAGVYQHSPGGHTDADMWTQRALVHRDGTSDNAIPNTQRIDELMINGQANSANPFTGFVWEKHYNRISRCNYFLENIDQVNMDEAEKVEMKAEVRFIRASAYFYLSQYYGGVPLVTKVLSVDEANSMVRASKEEVVSFILDEYTAAANDLPDSRPASEKGRAPKAAALAFKGRLLMAENRWAEAEQTYKSIIDLGIYEIDPRYKEIFLVEGENSSEIIFATQYIQDVNGSGVHYNFGPQLIGGTNSIHPLNDLVEAYEMTDGQTIDESPMYDPDNPFENRDPRLYSTVLLPNYSTINGQLFVSHPDSANATDRMPTENLTGYGVFKGIDPAASFGEREYGGDRPIIRYAEVLLSYLESKLEAGDPITQDLLDQTINEVRGRASVDMPPVTETNPDNLRPILRRERRVELALEGIRRWDLFRWRIAHIKLNGQIFGAKICDDPSNCGFQTDDEGHFLIYTRNFREDIDYTWPIPQSEIDINPNLTQNPGY